MSESQVWQAMLALKRVCPYSPRASISSLAWAQLLQSVYGVTLIGSSDFVALVGSSGRPCQLWISSIPLCPLALGALRQVERLRGPPVPGELVTERMVLTQTSAPTACFLSKA